MSDSPSIPHAADRPEDFEGLRSELGALLAGFLPVADDLWPRLQDHRSRWEVYRYGLPDGYNGLIVSDIVDLLGTALINLAGARDRISQASLRADDRSRGT